MMMIVVAKITSAHVALVVRLTIGELVAVVVALSIWFRSRSLSDVRQLYLGSAGSTREVQPARS